MGGLKGVVDWMDMTGVSSPPAYSQANETTVECGMGSENGQTKEVQVVTPFVRASPLSCV